MPARPPADHTSIWRSPATGIEGYHAAWIRHETLAHTHAEYQLLLTVRGSGRYRYRGAWQTTGAGEFLVFHTGEAHTLVPDGHWEFLALHLPTALFADGAAAEPFFPQRAPRSETGLREAFAAVCRGQAESGSVTRLVDALLERTVAPGEDGRLVDPLIAAVKLYLEERLGENLSLTSLAARFGVHPTRLCRQFSRQVGISPHAFHLQMRLREAKRLLHAGEPLTEIAAATGFTDQSHLTRHFTRLLGAPPGRYARFVKNVQDGGGRVS